MDEDILTGGLLDFGSSDWRTDLVRNKFTGLAGGGFRPRGRFDPALPVTYRPCASTA
jgi:hypothetical protein